MAYHYSSLLHLPYILLSEELRPSRRDAHGNHRVGLLWFSDNSVMERTALKENTTAIRFVSDAGSIGPWRGVAKSVGFSSGVMRRLERSGRAMGAMPHQWLAMKGALPLSDVDRIEVLTANGWKGLDLATIHVREVAGAAVRLEGPGGLVTIVVRQKTAEGYFAYATNKDVCKPDNLLGEALRKAG